MFEKLFTGIFEEEDVAIVEWVTNLEGVDGISTAGLDLFADLVGSESVFVHTVVEVDSLGEVHAFSGDEPVSLSKDCFCFGVFGAEGAESTGTDFFLSILEEHWIVDNSKNIV